MAAPTWSQWYPWDKTIAATLKAAQAALLEEQGYGSLEEALEATETDGTSTVLDLTRLGDEAESGQCWQLSEDDLQKHFGSATPTKAVVDEKVGTLLEQLEHGEALCVVAYANGRPAEVLFAGWSYG